MPILAVCIVLFQVITLKAAPAAANKPEVLSMDIPYGQLTLIHAQQIALEASPVVEEMLARIEEAQAIARQKQADWWPTMSVHAGQDWQNWSTRPDWKPEKRMDESSNHFNAGIQVNWLLFDGFSRRASILAAKARVLSAQELSNEARRLLAESVAGTYYQAQLAAEAMQIARQNALFNRNLEHDAEKRFLAGDIPEAEYLNFSVKSLQAENHFLKARQELSAVCIMLAKLLALPGSELPKDMYPEVGKPIQTLAQLPELADELNYALQHRPDLQALAAQSEALTQDKHNIRGSYYPKITAHSSYDYDKYNNYGSIDQDEHGSTVGLRLSWDIFSGGKRSARIQAADAGLLQLQKQKQQKILEIKAALQEALVKAESSRAVYQRECYTLMLVQKIRDHVERSYRAGATTLTRLNEAQSDLVSVSAAVAISRINYLQQLESLRAASGRILEEV